MKFLSPAHKILVSCSIVFFVFGSIHAEEEISDPFTRVSSELKTVRTKEVICKNLPAARDQGPFGACVYMASALVIDTAVCKIYDLDAKHLRDEQKCSVLDLGFAYKGSSGISVGGRSGGGQPFIVLQYFIESGARNEAVSNYEKTTRANLWKDKAGFSICVGRQHEWRASYDSAKQQHEKDQNSPQTAQAIKVLISNTRKNLDLSEGETDDYVAQSARNSFQRKGGEEKFNDFFREVIGFYTGYSHVSFPEGRVVLLTYPKEKKNGNYSDAIKFICGELQNNSPVSVVINVSGHRGIIDPDSGDGKLHNAVPRSVWTMKTETEDGVVNWVHGTPRHAIVITGYRVVRNSIGECMEILQIQNSWGDSFQKYYSHEESNGWVEAKPLLDHSLYAQQFCCALDVRVDPEDMTHAYLQHYQPKLTNEETERYEKAHRALAYKAKAIAGVEPEALYFQDRNTGRASVGSKVDWVLWYKEGNSSEGVDYAAIYSNDTLPIKVTGKQRLHRGWNRIKGKVISKGMRILIESTSTEPFDFENMKLTPEETANVNAQFKQEAERKKLCSYRGKVLSGNGPSTLVAMASAKDQGGLIGTLVEWEIFISSTVGTRNERMLLGTMKPDDFGRPNEGEDILLIEKQPLSDRQWNRVTGKIKRLEPLEIETISVTPLQPFE